MSSVITGSGGPLAHSIAARMRGLIDAGNYRPGDVLPSVRRLATNWEVSPATIVHAYQRLVDEGIIISLPRIGFRVMARPADQRLDDQVPAIGSPTEPHFNDDQLRVLSDSHTLPFGHLATAVPDPDLLPERQLQQWIRRCLRNDPSCGFSYEFSTGDPDLRRQISRRFSMRGRSVDIAEVVITTGCTEALMLSLRTICAPGDVVAVESPTFFNHLQLLEHLRLRVIEIPIDPNLGLDPERLDEACQRHAVKALLTVPVLHNPFGATLSSERQAALLRICEQHHVAVVEDVIYAGLGAERDRPSLFRDHRTTVPVLTCGSVSKVLAPGWRIGWVLAGKLGQQITQAKVVSSLGSPTLQQQALAGFLAGGGERSILERAANVYRERLLQGRALVRQHFPAGTRCSDPDGGLVLWLELPPEVDITALYRTATSEGLCFAPGSIFGLHHRHSHNLRLSIACLDHPTAQAIARIGRMACAQVEQ